MDLEEKNSVSLKKMPKPTITRLCKMYSFLKEMKESGEIKTSSNKIGRLLGIESHTVRKDLNYFGEIGTTGSGYEVAKLLEYIENKLGFNHERRACIVGLGRLGTAIMSYEKLFEQKFNILAGFDSNINKLETMKTDIPLYPAYDIKEITKQKQIELAILTVPGKAAKEVSERLIQGGIKGIINFTSIALNFPEDKVYIRNIDFIDELRLISAMMTLDRC